MSRGAVLKNGVAVRRERRRRWGEGGLCRGDPRCAHRQRGVGSTDGYRGRDTGGARPGSPAVRPNRRGVCFSPGSAGGSEGSPKLPRERRGEQLSGRRGKEGTLTRQLEALESRADRAARPGPSCCPAQGSARPMGGAGHQHPLLPTPLKKTKNAEDF